MTRSHAKAKKVAKPQEQGFWQRSLRAFCLTLAVGAGIILCASLAAVLLPDPASATLALGLVAALLTAFLGGVITGKLHGSAPALCGLCNGALLLSLMLLCSLLLRGRAFGYSTALSVLLHTLIPLISVFGALVGTRRHGSRSKRAKR